MAFSENDKAWSRDEFRRTLAAGDYVSAVTVLASLHSNGLNGNDAVMLAAELLRETAEKGVSVSQKIGTVEAGSTVVGYQGRRIGG